ncbi:TIGR03085 family metal-binding protein [Actinokineospora sp.]|uniref:TIGR03085 family metal-binding protein n=1 Tax=Actinokineospora sp. TaxID=1872133 RepID=UPI004037C0F4
MSVAKDERARLSDLFTEVGPDAPTLCGDWTTRDLAAHLVVRERRLDAVPGLAFKPMEGYLRRAQDGYAAKPWPELVDLVRGGPPLISPYTLGFVDDLINTPEFFIHHEDVRRAAPGWEPRPADATRDSALWTTIGRAARLLFRKSPVGVVLRTVAGKEITAKRGPDTVTIVAEPGELLLFGYGRNESRVDFEGGQASIGVVRGLSRGV